MLGMKDDAEFIKNLADALDTPPRCGQEPEQVQDEQYIVIIDSLHRALADGLREVYRRSLTH